MGRVYTLTISKARKDNKMEEIYKAIKQLKQAMKNVDKAEENAFHNRKHVAADALEKASLDIALICDNLRIANEMAMAKKGE